MGAECSRRPVLSGTERRWASAATPKLILAPTISSVFSMSEMVVTPIHPRIPSSRPEVHPSLPPGTGDGDGGGRWQGGRDLSWREDPECGAGDEFTRRDSSLCERSLAP
jgi:hypothetical protein